MLNKYEINKQDRHTYTYNYKNIQWKGSSYKLFCVYLKLSQQTKPPGSQYGVLNPRDVA